MLTVLRWSVSLSLSLDRSIDRRITQERSFGVAIINDPSIATTIVPFIKECDEALENAPRFGNEVLFIDVALIASNLSRGLYRHKTCPTKGPVRLYLKPSTIEGWSLESRTNFYRLISSWGKTSFAEQQAEINKTLSAIKDPEKREQKRQEFETLYRDIGVCARMTFEHFASTGPIFSQTDRRIQRDVLEWAVQAVRRCAILPLDRDTSVSLSLIHSLSANRSVRVIECCAGYCRSTLSMPIPCSSIRHLPWST